MQTHNTDCPRCHASVAVDVFCGRCGTRFTTATCPTPTTRGLEYTATAKRVVDSLGNDERFVARDKDVEKAGAEYDSFCRELGTTAANSTPVHARDFLAVCLQGKTVKSKTHTNTCPNYRAVTAATDPIDCDCDTSLRAASLQQTRYRVQAFLRNTGLTDGYNSVTRTGNPFKSYEVTSFVKAVAKMQADATVSHHEQRRVSRAEVERLQTTALSAFSRLRSEGKPLLAFRELRDALVCGLGFCTLDRGADIIRLRYSQLTITDEAISFGKSLSKTARTEAEIQAPVTIQSSRDDFCIVRLLRAYISFAKKLHVDVTTGPLLRGVRTQKRLAAGPGILGSMPTTADIRSRMAALCKRAGIPRAALHALRRGGEQKLYDLKALHVRR